MNPITFQIPDMQSTHCMNRVKTAVDQIEGVQIQKLTKGLLEVLTDSAELESSITQAIEKAGYYVQVNAEVNNAECHSSCCTVKS